MDFYQAAIIRDVTGRYACTGVAKNGNPLRTRVDHFTDGPKVMRLSVAPEDSMGIIHSYVDPRALFARYCKHAARERARIAAALAPKDTPLSLAVKKARGGEAPPLPFRGFA